MKNIIIAITGASGAIYGKKLLELLHSNDNVNTHLVISKAAAITIKHELDINHKALYNLADYHYNHNDISCCLASGSFDVDGMIIAPCSIKTMSAISISLADNLITRAADVILKERKRLLLCVRETPFHSIHLKNMKRLSDAGTIIFPPVAAFYNKPKSIDEMIEDLSLIHI